VIQVSWAEPPCVTKLRGLLSAAASEAPHDVGSPDAQAQIVEMVEAEPGLLDLTWRRPSPAEAEVWARVLG